MEIFIVNHLYMDDQLKECVSQVAHAVEIDDIWKGAERSAGLSLNHSFTTVCPSDITLLLPLPPPPPPVHQDRSITTTSRLHHICYFNFKKKHPF